MLAQPVSPFARVIKALSRDLDTITEDIIQEYNVRFKNQLNNISLNAWLEMSPVLVDVPVNRENEIINNSTSSGIVSEAAKIYETMSFGTTFNNALQRYLVIYTDLRNAVEGFYRENVGEFDSAALNGIETSARRFAREEITFEVMGEIVPAFRGNANRNISAGITRQDFLSNARDFVVGNASAPVTINSRQHGAQTDRTQPIISTQPSQYIQQLSRVIKSALTLVWFQYRGIRDDRNRDFCTDHIDKYYHVEEIHKEIIQPTKGEWDGMIPNTNANNFEINRGGFGCRHQVVYVPRSEVPPSVVARAKRNGIDVDR